jgi:hypothetical protein
MRADPAVLSSGRASIPLLLVLAVTACGAAATGFRAARLGLAVADAFAASYGAALDDLWQEALTASPEGEGVPIWECAAEPLALDGAVADLSDGCDGRGSFATLELAAEASLTWRDDTLTSGFNVFGCALDHPLHALQLGWTGGLETGALGPSAGRYYLAPTAGVGRVAIVAAPNTLVQACAEAAPLSLPAATSRASVFRECRRRPCRCLGPGMRDVDHCNGHADDIRRLARRHPSVRVFIL